MTYFGVLSNLVIGIIGGAISSIIVTRVFFIQGNLNDQISQFEKLLNKLGYTGGLFAGSRVVLEFTHDSQIDMEREMKEKGFKTEDEYYKAHEDKSWISSERLLNDLLQQVKKVTQTMEQELINVSIKEKELLKIQEQLRAYVHRVLSLKECKFSTINDIERTCEEVNVSFKDYKSKYNKVLIYLVLKDKVMIGLFTFFLLIVCITSIAYIRNW